MKASGIKLWLSGFLIACLFWGLSAPAQSLPQNPVFYSLSEADGLTDNAVTAFFQDSRGIMWLCTAHGLNSYDGSAVERYVADGRTGLAGNDVTGVVEDAQGVLWISTTTGLSRFHEATRTFTTYRTSDVRLNAFHGLTVLGDTVFLASDVGLVAFSKSRHRFLFFPNTQGSNAANRLVKVVAQRNEHGLWLCSYDGLWAFDPAHHRFTAIDHKGNDPTYDGLINDVLEDREGYVWFGCWNKGLKRYDEATGRIISYLGLAGSHTNVVTLASLHLSDGKEQLWVSNTLGILDTVEKRFEMLPLTKGTMQTLLPANRLYADHNGLLWIATDDGVKIYGPARQFFRTVLLSSSIPLSTQPIALRPLRSGVLVGAEGSSAVSFFSNEMTQLRNYSKRLTRQGAVMDIVPDGPAHYWLCTARGLLYADSSLRILKSYAHDKADARSLPVSFTCNLLRRQNGEVWAFPWMHGIWRKAPAEEFFQPLRNAAGDTVLSTANVARAVEDERDYVWIADFSGGLYRIKIANGQMMQVLPAMSLSDAVLVGEEIWTASSDSVFAIHTRTLLQKSWALPSDMNKYTVSFAPDGKGHLWIATRNGLLSFNRATGSFQPFTEADGLYANAMDVSFAQLQDGRMLMVSPHYATTFDPSVATQPCMPPPLRFRGAWADDSLRLPCPDGSYSFQWGERAISLCWAVQNYSNGTGNRYFYRLEGIDQDWQDAGHRGQVTYHSLPPGTYRFHFYGATSCGVKSVVSTVMVVVRPPFWQTWLFRIVCLLSFGILSFAVGRYITRRRLAERILVLEKKQAIERERNRISRDMHDDLGSGLTRIAILGEVAKTQQANAGETLDKISTTARNLVDNLDEMVWALNPQNDALDKLATYIAEYATGYLEPAGISFLNEGMLDIPAVPLSEEKRRNVFMAVKEFLSNTVKYSGATSVTMHLHVAESAFELSLHDDGRGFGASALKGMGNGLKNMVQRLEDIGGSATLSGNDSGTTLVMCCPFP